MHGPGHLSATDFGSGRLCLEINNALYCICNCVCIVRPALCISTVRLMCVVIYGCSVHVRPLGQCLNIQCTFGRMVGAYFAVFTVFLVC